MRVHASSVDQIDTIVRSGTLRVRTGKNFPKRTGIDFAGEVVAIAPDAPHVTVGERVWGVMPLAVERGVGQGSTADFITIATTRLAASPQRLSSIAAASISIAGASVRRLPCDSSRRPSTSLSRHSPLATNHIRPTSLVTRH